MKMDSKNASFGTRAIHAGNIKDKQNHALTMPIYQTSTFYFDSCEQGAALCAGEEEGYVYSRTANPTRTVLEAKIANLEGGEAACTAASGMGAISATLWTIAGAGKHIIADGTLYGCTFSLLNHGFTRYGVEVTFVDTSNIEEVKANLKENTVAVYLETPANPNLKITDIKTIAKVAHEYNKDIKVVCDNTFASPYLQRPLELGADVVVHSATKYINGHGDVIAGLVIGKEDFITEVRNFGIKDMTGSVLSPMDSFLILRGLKTLEVRMKQHCSTAMEVAKFLDSCEEIEKVYYPGLEHHPGYEIAKEQMRDFGGMIAFEVKGGKAAGAKLVNSVELLTIAVSLGDAETLLQHPASMTHATYNSEELAEAGIAEGLVRLSIGLEAPEDIIADLRQAIGRV
jgi:methionine-gamma-lyase